MTVFLTIYFFGRGNFQSNLQSLHSPKYEKSMLKLCLGYEKYIAFNTYANTIQNPFIVLTWLCIYYAIESYAFPSDLHHMYSLISLVTNKEISRDKVRSSLLAINFYCQVVAPKGHCS